LIGGVDFQKGCFIGQEVVSRVERRESARKRVMPVAFEDAAPVPGIEVQAGDRPAGFMGSAAGRLGMAMLRLDRVDEALKEGGKIVAGGIELKLWQPGWASFPIPGAAGASQTG
jgi:folate-binding Fe-S cluster repair protein YgfZ